MNKDDVYHSLVIDLVKSSGVTMFSARKIVEYLKQEQHINDDRLKEYYKAV